MPIAKLKTALTRNPHTLSVNTICFPLTVSLQLGTENMLVVKDAQQRTIAHLASSSWQQSVVTNSLGKKAYVVKEKQQARYSDTHCYDAFGNHLGQIDHGIADTDTDEIRVHVFKGALLKYSICNDEELLKNGRLARANTTAANDEMAMVRVSKQPCAVMVDYKRQPLFTMEKIMTSSALGNMRIHKTAIVAQEDAGLVLCALIDSAFAQLMG